MNYKAYDYTIAQTAKVQAGLIISEYKDWFEALLLEPKDTQGTAYSNPCTLRLEDAEKLDESHPRRGLKEAKVLWYSRYLWLDFDSAEAPDKALEDAVTVINKLKRCPAEIDGRPCKYNGEGLLLFHSGAKGYHLLIPTSLFSGCRPSSTFHAEARQLAFHLAGSLSTWDDAVYDTSRAFRMPNTPNTDEATGKLRGWKVPVALDGSGTLTVEAIQAGAVAVPVQYPVALQEIPTAPEGLKITNYRWPQVLEPERRPRSSQTNQQQATEWPDGVPTGTGTVTEDFNAHFDPRPLLESHGWQYHSRGEGLRSTTPAPGAMVPGWTSRRLQIGCILTCSLPTAGT